MKNRSGARHWVGQIVGLAIFAAASSAAAEPPRVALARKNHQAEIAALFAKAHVAYPAGAVLLRAFKDESELELWAGPDAAHPLTKITTYKICAKSGGPGPKSTAGDGQVPDGFYSISELNPASSYHLSMRVDYPNQADRLRAKPTDARALGGDIFIHGNCVTIGCLPIRDGPIEQLYVIVDDAKAQGAKAWVHIFPARLETPRFSALESAADAKTRAFWESLRAGYDSFEASHRIPRIRVDTQGNYFVQS